MIMLMGYAIIAIPTGIVTAEIALLGTKQNNTLSTEIECSNCHKHFHASGAKFCNNCGTSLEPEPHSDTGQKPELD
jgi:voltage-gated potassium channel